MVFHCSFVFSVSELYLKAFWMTNLLIFVAHTTVSGLGTGFITMQMWQWVYVPRIHCAIMYPATQRQPSEWPDVGSECQTGDNTQWDYVITWLMMYNILFTRAKILRPGSRGEDLGLAGSSYPFQWPEGRIVFPIFAELILARWKGFLFVCFLFFLAHGKLNLLKKCSSLFPVG